MLLDIFLFPSKTLYLDFIIPVPAILLVRLYIFLEKKDDWKKQIARVPYCIFGQMFCQGIFIIGKDILRILEVCSIFFFFFLFLFFFWFPVTFLYFIIPLNLIHHYYVESSCGSTNLMKGRFIFYITVEFASVEISSMKPILRLHMRMTMIFFLSLHLTQC